MCAIRTTPYLQTCARNNVWVTRLINNPINSPVRGVGERAHLLQTKGWISPNDTIRSEERPDIIRNLPLDKRGASSSDSQPKKAVASRRPETKLAKICEQPDVPEFPENGPSAPGGVLSRRQSSGSISPDNKRLPAGSEQTTAGSGSEVSRKIDPYRGTVYHFDDDPHIARQSEMNATARSLLRHDLPTRRHNADGPVQQVNNILTAAPTKTTTPVPVAQGADYCI